MKDVKYQLQGCGETGISRSSANPYGISTITMTITSLF